MATTYRPVNSLEVEDWEDMPVNRRRLRSLGLLNGVLIGEALALGAWGVEVWRLSGLPVQMPYAGLLLGFIIILGITSLVGWLTATWRHLLPTMLVWAGTAVLSALLMVNLPTRIQTLSVWMIDGRFWGLPIYPAPQSIPLASQLFAGLFLILSLILLSFFQSFRLNGLNNEFQGQPYPRPRAWLWFMFPLWLVVAASFLTSTMIANPFGASLRLVDHAIQVARTEEGDLFARGLADGISYAALNGVRDQLSGPYTLSVGEIDLEASTTYVLAYFDNGAWIKCRLVGEQLSFCQDASRPYTVGLHSLITGQAIPEGCRGCLPQVDPGLAVWLTAQNDALQAAPQIHRAGALGGYVFMRAAAPDGSFAITCLFHGVNRVQLDSCE